MYFACKNLDTSTCIYIYIVQIYQNNNTLYFDYMTSIKIIVIGFFNYFITIYTCSVASDTTV